MEGILFGILALGLVALVAFVAVALSNRWNIPHPILLIIAGIALKFLHFRGTPLIEPPKAMLVGFSIIALVVIVFDNCARLRLEFGSKEDKSAWSLAISSIVFFGLILTPIILILFYGSDLSSPYLWFLSLLVAILVAETSLDTISEHPKHIKRSYYRLIVKESIVNTPLILMIALFLIHALKIFGSSFIVSSEGVSELLSLLITAIAVAIVVGIVLFKWIRDRFVHHASPALLLVGAIVAFVLAEKMGGSGLVAVIFLGLFFGKIFVEKKAMLEEFSGVTASLFEVLVFILLGFSLPLIWNPQFLIASLIFYAFMVVVRFLVLSVICKEHSVNERWLMTLNAPLGISIAALALYFTLGVSSTELTVAVQLLTLVIFYSNVTHWAVRKQFS